MCVCVCVCVCVEGGGGGNELRPWSFFVQKVMTPNRQ